MNIFEMKRNEPVVAVCQVSREIALYGYLRSAGAHYSFKLTEFPLAVSRCQQARMALLRPAMEAALAAALR